MKSFKKQCLPSLTALSLALTSVSVLADERQSLEALKQTTLGLIEALVDKGVLTRDAADAMLRQAQQRAAATTQAAAPGSDQLPSGKPVQRVPYVSETMKAQIRSELKEEILTQARAENWATPNAIPSWVNRIKIEGDLRYRHQLDRFDSDNTPPSDYVATLDSPAN